MIRVSVAGATGYTGMELVRLLVRHPEVTLQTLTADSNSGKPFSEVCPSMTGIVDQELKVLSEQVAGDCDFLFLALPHCAAMSEMEKFLNAGCKVIDLSADFRLHDAKVFETWYKTPHVASELLPEAVYGLPELHKKEIQQARLVANPGCYTTSVILAAAPLMATDWVDPDSIIADSKSGVSGAGRKANAATQFCETNEGVSAYGLTAHRHTPEIEQELGLLLGRNLCLQFSPHLMPMTRGILSTVYLNLKQEMSASDLINHYQQFYKDAPFVRILPEGQFAATQNVSRSNYCDLGIAVDSRTRRVIITSAIDNLMKGASSQAVQNMNLMAGLEECSSLDSPPVFP